MTNTNRDLAIPNEILRGVVGSTAHGTAIEGQDDCDEMGVCIEPEEYVLGLEKFEQYIYRDKPEGVRSEAGDLDLVVYSLRKFCRLAAKGNPSVLILLWLPSYTIRTSLGDNLISIREAFISQESGKRFLGYLRAQKKSLCGLRAKKVNRPELVKMYGFDTKFAMHALRLGFQGVEYLTTGRITLPVPEPKLSVLRAVRKGQVPLKKVVELIEGLEQELELAIVVNNSLADIKTINSFLGTAHYLHWKSN